LLDGLDHADARAALLADLGHRLWVGRTDRPELDAAWSVEETAARLAEGVH